MKKFLQQVAIFSFIIVALIVIIECTLRRVPTIYAYKQQLVEERGEQMRNVVLGSSIVDCGIDPTCLSDSSYNLAIAGQWYRYTTAFARKNIDRMPRLRTIVFGICYHSFWCDDSMEQDMVSYVSHHIYMGIGRPHNLFARSELLASGSAAMKKWSKYYVRRKPTMHCDSLGLDHSFDLPGKPHEWLEEIPDDVKWQTDLACKSESEQLFGENLNRLDDLARLCADRGINLLFVIPPVHKDYLACTDAEQWKKVEAALATLKRNWPGVDFRNYAADPRFVDDDFYDAHHLSADVGAGKFTRILRDDFASLFR
ncbi:MAG: hypothetical protein IJ494_08730 [Bacteroides sp.]|nr:hypothetical protein [Bacteroides sp.]